MPPALIDLFVIALAWSSYAAIHSVLASLETKRWVASRWPALLPAYRLCFNAQALLLVIPPLWLTATSSGPYLWRWQGSAFWFANGVALLAVFGFIWSLRYYDSGEFIGWRQWRARACRVEDQEQFHLSPLHRCVRHPWYFLGLVILWTRDINAAWLLTDLFVTGYLVVGSRLEERKLLVYHGEAYRRYRDRVPALVPIPGRCLGADEAEALVRLAAEARAPSGGAPQ